MLIAIPPAAALGNDDGIAVPLEVAKEEVAVRVADEYDNQAVSKIVVK